MARGDTHRHPAAPREFEPRVLNGLQRSVNRKVQGSNPWSGAKSELKTRVEAGRSSWGRQQPRRVRLLSIAVNLRDGPDGGMNVIRSRVAAPEIRLCEGWLCSS